MNEMEALKELIDELAEKNTPIDTAISNTELKLKRLRALKNSLKVEAEPTPRTKKGDKAA